MATTLVVDHGKLLGSIITNNLSWNIHVFEVVKKASKHLYFLRQLNVVKADLLTFYSSCIRSTCDYAAPVLHASLPQYLIEDLERADSKKGSCYYKPHLFLCKRSNCMRPGVTSSSSSAPKSIRFR